MNEATVALKAHWFFTPKTIPDKQLLRLLDSDKHEIDLHVVNRPIDELERLETKTGKRPVHYTIHGTERLAARIMWRRLKSKTPQIPQNFPLESFHELTTTGLDSLAYSNPLDRTLQLAEERIAAGDVIYFHPVWLFQRGRINHRGPFYHPLRKILNVDNELETIAIQSLHLFKLARDYREYEKDIIPSAKFFSRLTGLGADVFTFIERSWLRQTLATDKSWTTNEDNVALYEVTTYSTWLETVGKKTRNMVRKAEKTGVKTLAVKPDERTTREMWSIYNETPFRQGAGFPHYGITLDTVKANVNAYPNATFIGAYLNDELIGFIRLLHGKDLTYIDQILSLQKHMDKAVNNALIAKAIEYCASNSIRWLMYGRMGNHPTLDTFKQNNGFKELKIKRFYVPLTVKGKLALSSRLHREMKDTLPQWLKKPLFPLYGWASRTKMKLKLALDNRNK